MHPYIKNIDIPSRVLSSGAKNVTLICDLKRPKSYNAKNLKLKWLKKEFKTGKFIEISETDKQKINLNPNDFSLEILNLNFTDSGTYMCKIQTNYGEHYREFDLIVYGNFFNFYLLLFIHIKITQLYFVFHRSKHAISNICISSI